MIPGVDCHAGYGLIDWAKVAASGIRFAIAKCTEGNEPAKDDGSFLRNVNGMRMHGIVPGGYHFPYPLLHDGVHAGRSPQEQVERAWIKSQGLGSRLGELPHVVDAEWPEVGDWGKWGVTASSIAEWLHEYCELATMRWGRKPIIYTYPFWWRAVSYTNIAWAGEYDLWIANYTHPGGGVPADCTGPIVPPPWDQWAIWQYSAKGSSARVPGIEACPVDRDCIRDARTFARLIGTDAADTEPAPATPPVIWPDFPIVHPPVPLDDDDPPDVA